MSLPGREGGQVLLGEEDQRCVGVLQHAVDDDVVLGQERRQRHAPVAGDRGLTPLGVVVAVQVHDLDE